MARLIGPEESSRPVYTLVGGTYRSAAGLTATIYADQAATTLADILTQPGGAPISGSTLTVDSTSRLPRIQYPDGVTTVYATVAGGPVVAMPADTSVDALTTVSDTRYGRYELARSMSPAAGVLAALYRGKTTVVQLVGDSTGDATAEWFALLGQKIGQAYPNFNVLHRAWNLTNQWYDLPTSLQAGPSGDARITMAGSCAAQYPGTATTGDLDVRLRLGPSNWVPGALRVPICRWNSTGNQRGWWFGLNSTGLLCLTWTTDGTAGTQVQKFSTVVNGLSGVQWIRATLDVDNGASGNDLKFYTSPDGVTWTQLGATVTTAGVTSVFASTAPYQIGSLDSSFGSTFVGDMYWIEVRDGIGGISLVPPLPDTWDQMSNSNNNTILLAGSPTLLMLNGSEGGQNYTYFDNATRRPKVLSPHRQDLLIGSSGHNEAYNTNATWINTVSSWVTNAKTLVPNVPIVLLTQNPEKSSQTQNDIEVRSRRGVALMAWTRAQTGVYGLDTYPAFTDMANQVQSDGVHPTTAGSQAWRDYVYRALFQAG